MLTARAASPESGPGDRLTPPPDAEFVRERLATLRAQAPTCSADGRIQIAGSALNAADKLLLLRFVEDVRGRLSRLMGVPFEGPAHAIAVQLEADKSSEGGRVDAQVAVPDPFPIRLVLRNPLDVHPPEVTARLCSALLRADVLAKGYVDPQTGASVASRRSHPYPVWFGEGLARWLDAGVRQQDSEAVLARWNAAQLPGVGVLADAFSPYAAADPALASQLAAWFLDGPERAVRFDRLRDELARGTPWSAALFVRAVGCKPLPGCADADWDVWLLARRWVVLDPGTTPPGLVRRTRDQLRLWPGAPGMPLGVVPARRAYEPRELIELRDEPWVPDAAATKLAAVVRLGAGRDAAYGRMAAAYAEFFQKLRDRDSKRGLVDALDRADELLEVLENAESVGLEPAG